MCAKQTHSNLWSSGWGPEAPPLPTSAAVLSSHLLPPIHQVLLSPDLLTSALQFHLPLLPEAQLLQS